MQYFFSIWSFWDIKIPKPPHKSFLKIIGLGHFLQFLGSSERYCLLQLLLITLYIKMVENDLDFRVCPEASTGDKGNMQILLLWVSHLHCGRRCQWSVVVEQERVCATWRLNLQFHDIWLVSINLFQPYGIFETKIFDKRIALLIIIDARQNSRLNLTKEPTAVIWGI